MSIAVHIIASNGATALTASASPSSVSGTGNNSGAITITTGSTTVTPSGGLSAYTYAWSIVSGTFTITSPSSPTTTFSKSQGPGTSTGTARCTVTDAIGQTAAADVSLSVSNNYVAPNPPVWTGGGDLGTWTRGGAFLFVNVFADCANPGDRVIYSTVSDFPYSGGSGPEPNWPGGITGGGSGQIGGQASAGLAPGTYSATFAATNPDDSSSALVSVSVTIV